MEKYHFDLLNDSLKGHALLKSGVRLASRIYKCFEIILFQVDCFYVEVFYHLKFMVIQYMRSFESTDELDPYFQSINISDLIMS